MKKFGNVIKFITLVSAGMFLLNIPIMMLLFDINVLNIEKRTIPIDVNEIYKSEAAAVPMPEKKIESNKQNEKEAALSKAVEFKKPSDKSIDDKNNRNTNEIESEVLKDRIYHVDNYSVKTPEILTDSKEELYMTSADVDSLEALSLAAKLEAVSLISKITAADSKNIYSMSSNGVTFEEKSKIENILKRTLTKQEIKRLIELLDKR